MRASWTVALISLLVPTVTWAAAGDDGRRHLAAIEVYLKDAQSNARVVSQVSEFGREGVANLERSLATCERHLAQLESVSEIKQNGDKLQLVARDLRDVRAQIPALRAAIASGAREQIRTAAAGVGKALQRADDDFGLLAAGSGLSQSELSDDDRPEEKIPDFLPPRY